MNWDPNDKLSHLVEIKYFCQSFIEIYDMKLLDISCMIFSSHLILFIVFSEGVSFELVNHVFKFSYHYPYFHISRGVFVKYLSSFPTSISSTNNYNWAYATHLTS